MCWVPSSVSRMRKRSSGQLFFVLLKHHDHRLLTEGISETHPFGSDADAGHVRGHLAYPLHSLRTLLRTKVPLSASLILGSDSLYRLDMSGAPNEQGMVGKLVAIDGQGDLRVIGQHVHLRGVRRGPKHDRLAIPMEPDRYHAWCPITPRVGQSCEVGGVQQLLCNRIIEEGQIPPFSRHFSLLS